MRKDEESNGLGANLTHKNSMTGSLRAALSIIQKTFTESRKEGYLSVPRKKRWITLGYTTLTAYKDNKCQKLIFVILLSDVQDVDKVNKSKKKFIIETKYKKWEFCVNNEDERNKWIKEINLVKNGEVNQENTNNVVSINDFDLLKLVGQGAFGKVYQVRRKNTGDIYAMKILSKKYIVDNNEVIHTVMERNVMTKMNNPFLIKLYHAFQTQEKLIFIMEFALGGDLFYHLRKAGHFDNDTAKYYAAEVILGMQYLHENGVVYRDIKPENLLLDGNGHIIITDFGLAKENMKDAKTLTVVGTPEYVAPEILEEEPYDFAVDWWGVGILIYEMLVGETPFYSQNHNIMFNKIKNGDVFFPNNVEENAKDLIQKLLTKDASDRLVDPLEIREHKWFEGLDFLKLHNKEIQPPITPGTDNLENFDKQITTLDVNDVLEDEENSDVDETLFENFAFSRPSYFGNLHK